LLRSIFRRLRAAEQLEQVVPDAGAVSRDELAECIRIAGLASQDQDMFAHPGGQVCHGRPIAGPRRLSATQAKLRAASKSSKVDPRFRDGSSAGPRGSPNAATGPEGEGLGRIPRARQSDLDRDATRPDDGSAWQRAGCRKPLIPGAMM